MNFTSTLHLPVTLPSLGSLAMFKPSLNGLRRWLAGSPAADVRPMQRDSLRHTSRQLRVSTTTGSATKLIAIHTSTTRGKANIPALRVVRVHESGQARSSVGRMVISGRMTDVCAELDRLAALETQALAAPTR